MQTGHIALYDAGVQTSGEVNWAGGRGVFFATSSSWSGGSIKLQFRTPKLTWIDVDTSNVSLAADGMKGFEIPGGPIRATVTGSPTAVNCWVAGTTVV